MSLLGLIWVSLIWLMLSKAKQYEEHSKKSAPIEIIDEHVPSSHHQDSFLEMSNP